MSYSNFITPPDFVDEKKHTVVLIDAVQDEVEVIADFCRYAKKDYNVYLYSCEMTDLSWLDRAVKLADAVIINTINTTLDSVKLNYANNSNTWVYGPNTSTTNIIKNPREYFFNDQSK